MKTNYEEQCFEEALKKLSGYVALSLYPGFGLATISDKQENRAFINEGRQGKFENISLSFYDEMVSKYDTRCKIKK